MNIKERRLKRLFLRRKKRAIIKATVECKSNVDAIMNGEHIPFIKLSLSVAAVAAWQRYVDMVRAQSYYPDGGVECGETSIYGSEFIDSRPIDYEAMDRLAMPRLLPNGVVEGEQLPVRCRIISTPFGDRIVFGCQDIGGIDYGKV